MSLAVLCPACRSSFKVAEEHAGKTTKCPKCKAPFKIGGEPIPRHDSPPALPKPLPPPPVEAISKPSINGPVESMFAKGYRFPRWVTVAATFTALLVGFFLGREYLRYELRTLLTDSGRAFSKGMKESFADSFGPDRSETGSGPVIGQSAQPEATPIKKTPFGERFDAPGFEVSVVAARIDHPEIKNINGELGRGTDPCLLISFRVKNTDDRKVIVFQSYLDGSCTVHDDVGNQIRGMSFGFTSKVVGQLRPEEEIVPGLEVTHVETFKVPLPKTKHLVVTLNLKAFGGTGEAIFEVPAERIENFPQ